MECTLKREYPVFSFKNSALQLDGGILVIKMKVLYPNQPIIIQVHYTNESISLNIKNFIATNEFVDYKFQIQSNNEFPIIEFFLQEASKKYNKYYIKKIVFFSNDMEIPDDLDK